MKRKHTAPRNPLVAVARFKKAGAHVKSNKALRRTANVEMKGRSFYGEAAGFYPADQGSMALRPYHGHYSHDD